jgi:hypothetical protein
MIRSLRTWTPRAVIGVLFTCAALAPSAVRAADPPVAAPPVDPSARADALTKKAIEALKRDAPGDAEKLAREAWGLKQSYDIASNLGLAELGLKKHRDAAEHLAYALRFFPANGKPEHKKLLDVSFARARAEVTAVTVNTSLDGAEIWIDGARAGVAPMKDPVFVEVGTRAIEARREGYIAAKQTIEAKKGGAETVTLTLLREAPVVPTATASATTTTTEPPPRSQVPAFVIGGVGVASLVAGGVLVGVAESTRSDLDGGPKKADGSPLCTKAAPAGVDVDPACAKLRSLAGERATMGNVGLGLFAVGGVAFAGAAAYFFWPQPAAGSARSSKVVPIVGTNGAGVLWQGSF